MVCSSLQSSSKTAAAGCGVTTAPCHCHCVRHSHSSLFYRNDRFVLPVEQLNPLRILMGKYRQCAYSWYYSDVDSENIYFCVWLFNLMWKVFQLDMEDIAIKTYGIHCSFTGSTSCSVEWWVERRWWLLLRTFLWTTAAGRSSLQW